jgi:serine/threonine protein kinase
VLVVVATYSSLVGLAVGGKYEIRRVLGAGGMGVVCEAVHLDLGKRVAIKLIDKSMKESELIVTRFRREARAAGQINSEHIVDVFDVGADARVGLYMVMEHLAGEDLQSRLERDGRIDVKTGVMIAHQIARGLVKAHEAGVIHRDLKPANVFLTERDNGQMLVKLLDFGVSKLLDEAPGSARITGSGAPIGTPLYMSPEQAEGKDDVDGRADIWSLGAVVYEALAGKPPFADRGSYHGTIVGILTSRPQLLHDVAPWVPAPLAEVVDAMLVHDRAARIPNAAAVSQRLLDAFPNVLPDGTGKYSAVIVPQTAASVDATGDTEVFDASALPIARHSTPNKPLPPISDSVRTMPDSNDATRTAGATPVGGDRDPSGMRASSKTAPLPPSSKPEPARSSGTGVALPNTPVDLEPVSEIAPATERDDQLALRAERRRHLSIGVVCIVLLFVSAGSFIAGRRASPPTTSASPMPPASSLVAATPVPPPSVAPVVTASAAPMPSAVSLDSLPSAAPAPTPRRKPRPKVPVVAAPTTAPAEETPSPPPVVTPPPAPTEPAPTE